MKIARLLAPVHALGPGERICLWTQGCKKRCNGCIAPELQPFIGNDIEENVLSQMILRVAKSKSFSALTISGGDPFDQAVSLLELLKLLRPHFEDILVYTGYEIDAVKKGCVGKAGIACLRYIDVLIDGKYIDELNTPNCILRGSLNQQIHFLNSALTQRYTEYLNAGRIIEHFTHNNTTILVGILSKEEDL